jgi:hypothetical protein
VKEFESYQSKVAELGLKRTHHVLVADLGEKILGYWVGEKMVGSCPVSSGKRPRSCKQDSLGTPWGLHEVASKHGEDQPAGMIFTAREPTGQRWQEVDDEELTGRCLVTTRILRLRGLEPGVNAGRGIDSFDQPSGKIPGEHFRGLHRHARH